MKNFISATRRFLNDEEGASAIEYALILGMVALAIIGLTPGIATKVTAVFQNISDNL